MCSFENWKLGHHWSIPANHIVHRAATATWIILQSTTIINSTAPYRQSHSSHSCRIPSCKYTSALFAHFDVNWTQFLIAAIQRVHRSRERESSVVLLWGDQHASKSIDNQTLCNCWSKLQRNKLNYPNCQTNNRIHIFIN